MADIEKFVYYENGSKKVLKPTDRIVIGSGGLAFEGSTSDDFETSLAVTDPTADRTITFPDEDGDVALLQSDTLPKALSFPVKNPSTTTALTKGQVVYISGHTGNKPDVSLAQANSSSTMPAFGLVTADIAAEAEGYVTTVGLLKGLDTSTGYSLGDTVYVSASTAGALTTSAPTGSNLIQNIGKVTRIDASVGSILVGGAGRTAATPNLNQGEIFIGNASNQSSKSVYTLPIADGINGQVLQTNGSGALSFATPATGISYTEVTANIAAADFTVNDYQVASTVASNLTINLPTTYYNLSLAQSIAGKTFRLNNMSAYSVTLQIADAWEYSGGTYYQTYVRHSGQYETTGIGTGAPITYIIRPYSQVEINTIYSTGANYVRLVYNIIASGGILGGYHLITSDVSTSIAMNNIYIGNPAGSSITYTLPEATTIGVGERLQVKNIGSSGTIAIVGYQSGQVIDGSSSKSLSAGQSVTIIRYGTNDWITL